MAQGAQIQLTLVGQQGNYLTMDAQNSFFDSKHITYADFAVESVVTDAQGNPDFGKTAKFKFNGTSELISGGYIETRISALQAPSTGSGSTFAYAVAWVHMIGIYMFKSIEFTVNQSKIDIQYPQYLDMMFRLTIGKDRIEAFNDMIGEVNIIKNVGLQDTIVVDQIDPDCPVIHSKFSATGLIPDAPGTPGYTKPEMTLYFPLQFWWCKDYSQALPAGLLLFSGIEINVVYEEYPKLYMCYQRAINVPSTSWVGPYTTTQNYNYSTMVLPSKPTIIDAKLYLDQVFLEKTARDRLLSKALLYVIKQVKTPGPQSVKNSIENYRFSAAMPVASIYFGIQEDAAVDAQYKRYDWWDRFTGNVWTYNQATANSSNFNQLPESPIKDCRLMILSNERFTTRGWMYWTRYQPWVSAIKVIPRTRGIFQFHFALFPQDTLASGTINMSQTDNNSLYINMNNSVIKNGNTLGGIGQNGITGNIYFFTENHNYIFVENGYMNLLYTV